LDFADFANFAQIIKFCAKFCATKSWRLYSWVLVSLKWYKGYWPIIF